MPLSVLYIFIKFKGWLWRTTKSENYLVNEQVKKDCWKTTKAKPNCFIVKPKRAKFNACMDDDELFVFFGIDRISQI